MSVTLSVVAEIRLVLGRVGNFSYARMNKRGELIGLNFDSTYESITKDWYFDTAITRAIHLDIRYMLWVMKEVDHADNLLKEMTIKYPQAAKAAKK